MKHVDVFNFWLAKLFLVLEIRKDL